LHGGMGQRAAKRAAEQGSGCASQQPCGLQWRRSLLCCLCGPRALPPRAQAPRGPRVQSSRTLRAWATLRRAWPAGGRGGWCR
jgi:hypothetical protein